MEDVSTTDVLAATEEHRADQQRANERRVAEIAFEQGAVDTAHDFLSAMRSRAEFALTQAQCDNHMTVDRVDNAVIEATLRARINNLGESKAALVFGRIDESGTEGTRWHIGRRHVEDETGQPVVLDWRVPVAVPFYRATWADPFGLKLRRRLAVEGRHVAGLFDEDFTDPDGASEGGGVPDPLLAELERGRSGEMRDIVATIQAEQDVIIRASLDDLVVVQGGPGTGKTAVGLHRAAYLLYEHRRELERNGLLVVGPNDLFLRYISQVLPSLGERAVTQTTIERLPGLFVARAIETDLAVIKLKGDPRMAEVVHRAIYGRVTIPEEDVVLEAAFGSVTLLAEDLRVLVFEMLNRELASNDAREVLRNQLLAMAWRAYSRRETSDPAHNVTFHSDLKGRKGFKALLDRMWPAFSAGALVRSLLGSPKALAAAAEGILSEEEQQLLRRKSAPSVKEEKWTRYDLGLLDEAQQLIAGIPRSYGHVVVDEAQDLSAMELRMVARRSPKRSLTVLGDLAQATSVCAQTSWDDAMIELAHGHDDEARGRVCELTLGYRVPAPILELANSLLVIAAPLVTPSRSVRPSGLDPTTVSVDRLLETVSALNERWMTVGVISSVSGIDDVLAALSSLGAEDARKGRSLDEGVTVLGAVASKGLEFDAVVIVDPSGVIGEFNDVPRGSRALYVARTRAVQQLVEVTV
jgi:DNA helicase IV